MKRNLFLPLLCLLLVLLRVVASEAQTVETITSTASPTAATDHLFPQFADGRFSDGTYYRTTLMISNLSDTAGATCSLHDDSGNRCGGCRGPGQHLPRFSSICGRQVCRWHFVPDHA